MMASRNVRLRLFGSPSLLAEDGSSLTGPATQRHRLALLALLATSPDHGLGREKLMSYLWADRSPEHARQLLNQAVYSLRKALGEESLISVADDLRLNPEVVRSDVAEFEAAVGRGAHDEVVALYIGPFLDGLYLPNAVEFERWTERERGRLAVLRGRSLETLAESAERAGDYAKAVEWWRVRSSQDPYDSRVAVRLMEALHASGNRAGALQHAGIHERMLREEFDVGLSPEVQAVVDRLRTEPPSARARRTEIPSSAATPVPAQPLAPSQPLASAAPVSEASMPSAEPRTRRRAIRYVVSGLSLVVVAAAGLKLVQREGHSSTANSQSIAVLPLANRSADPRDAALADGMTEDLTSILAQTSGLRVIASTSAYGFRDRQIDVRIIGDSLGVENILEGGLQRDGSHLRVQVRLLDARDGSTRWAQRYDRELRDLFATQDEIARSVARELGVRLGAAANQQVRRQPTQSIAAYELYLKGSDRSLNRSDSTARLGLELFRQAVALDSNFAGAWAGLARMYSRLAPVSGARAEYLRSAMAAAQKAVALDDSLAEAHTTLAVQLSMALDLAAAEQHFLRAIALDPSTTLPHERLVTLYLMTNRPAEALAHAQQAVAIDPLSPTSRAELARGLIGNGRCDEAITQLKSLSGMRMPLLRVPGLQAEAYACKGMWSEAIAGVRPLIDKDRENALAFVGYLEARAGHRLDAQRVRDTLVARWRRGAVPAAPVALVLAGLGETDHTFEWLDRAVTDGSIGGVLGPTVFSGSMLSDVRRDPRFERLRARLGPQKR